MRHKDPVFPMIILFLALGVVVGFFLLFPGLFDAVITALGTIVCCFLAVILIVVVLVALAVLFAVPIFIFKKPPHTQYYTRYRIEEVRGMDEDPRNKRGPEDRP